MTRPTQDKPVSRRANKVQGDPVPPPPMPAETAEERAERDQLSRRMAELANLLQQRNLNSAVALAIQASRGHGPLVEHFAELGRRFGGELSKPQPSGRKALRVIDGGAA